MTRKKVKLALIENDNARRASLKKRRVGVVKKVGELCTLCNVSACIVIYSPEEKEPRVWPSVEMAVQMLNRFRRMPEMDRNKRTMNQESYLRERSRKTEEQLKKNQRKNQEKEMVNLICKVHEGNNFDELNLGELYGLAWLIEEKVKSVNKRLAFLNHMTIPVGLDPLYPTPHAQVIYDQTHEVGGNEGNNQVRDIIDNQDQGAFTVEPWLFDIMNNNNNIDGGFGSIGDNPTTNDIKTLPHQITYGRNSNNIGNSVSNNDHQMGLQAPLKNFKLPQSSSGLVDIMEMPLYENSKGHDATSVGDISHSSHIHTTDYPIGIAFELLQPPDGGQEVFSISNETTMLDYGHLFGNGTSNINGSSSNMGQQFFHD
ncbi:agamous-like MADS-box protein AGL23, partial [Carica papaya]|uniref:agamous-like MADS-box protein AGL23 n=1 Tax=Carica papaya TaxID=3649 RepID=UPI000B8C81FA